MSTTALDAPQTQPATDRIAGIVTTSPAMIWLLPDHIAHVSFHLDVPSGPGYNVHADGSRAELVRSMIHRGDAVTVIPSRVYRRDGQQIAPDVDVDTFELALR